MTKKDQRGAHDGQEIMERLHSMNRRAFMLRSSAIAAGVTLAPWMPRAALAQSGGTLEVMAWQGFTMEAETSAWAKAAGVVQRSSIISNQDDVTAKLAGSNPVRLDVTEYATGYEKTYTEMGVMQPIDLSKVPNFSPENIFPPFLKGEMWTWDGTQWGIPWIWGVDTIVVRPDLIDVEVTSYEDLLRPEFAGKLAILDNPVTTWPQIAKVTGYGDKFPNMTRAELDDCFEKFQPYRDQTVVFAASNGDVISLFASGEIAAVFCTWSAVPLETAKQNVVTKAVMPKEGAAVWADAWFIPTSAGNLDAAHGFINATLAPEAQAAAAQSTVASPVASTAVPLLDETTHALFDFENFDAAFASIRFYGQPPRTSDDYATYDDWLQKWADFRSGF